MGRIVALPARGEVVADARGEGRSLRVSWHHEAGVVVLSVWRDHLCAATVRVPAEDVPALVAALTAGLAEGYGEADPAGAASAPVARTSGPDGDRGPTSAGADEAAG